MAEISEKISDASFDATEKQSFVESDDSSNSDKKRDHNLVRNICILAHVDHGKTTLADHLIASYGGGVLHPKQAGKLRFMDYLDEEQRRAITMKSSSIALQFKRYFINLIDSPGHMDFCSEVSTAARLSDGALILVDAVEGVHIQTHAVLRQAWIEKLTPCLVLNKVDRLICELRLSPMEAYNRCDSMLSVAPSGDAGEENYEFIDDEEEDTFQPQKGNVIFACALDGWGFGVYDFAEFYASKLGASSAALQKALWGPHYFNAKTKMIVGKKGISSTAKARPMFVQFILEPLWQVYQSTLESDGDRGVLEKVIKSFNLSIPSRELQNKDPKAVLQAVMSRWLPLSDTILSMVVKCMPDPAAAQSFRISRLLPKRDSFENADSSDVLNEAELVRKSVEACNSSPTAPCVVFVSKMFAVPRVFVLSALYDPLKEESKQKHVQEADLQSLYLMMGQGLKPVASAKAGNIVAIRGLAQHILKSATLSSTINSWPFSSMVFQVAPTLKVAIEPSDPANMGALMKGLRLLNRADPFVEVTVSARGEHVLAAAGEVHLERCVKDLKERFAKVMRLPTPLTKLLDESSELLGDIIGGKSKQALKSLETLRGSIVQDENPIEALKKRMMDAIDNDLSSGISEMERDRVEKYRTLWRTFLTRIWALGPRQVGPNILFTPGREKSIEGSLLIKGFPYVSDRLGFHDVGDSNDTTGESSPIADEMLLREAESLESSVLSGFQLATSAGPLCDEPMWGLAFVVEAFISPVDRQSNDDNISIQQAEQYGMFTGQVMTAVKEACRAAVLQRKPRLVEALYFCELNTPTEHLGSMYAVLARRRARVIKEEMQEGSPLFTVHAYVPVAESFGFADELRRWTSGASSALLVLSHWEPLLEDPFFVPKTDEEIEEYGDGSSVPQNTARKLIDAVRRRKGLPVEEKVVQHATKQRTLARKV
ncbi:UNVERIFIED_CONTAM: Elongation factor-like GTPase 1 [Sesamum radiatum]|uniref:Elongation factor-like 1 n=1 Tax=Sesamum radiatum TaxID=300843 RepID=A0AAW2NCZ3_SESRA